jgi:glucokinase
VGRAARAGERFAVKIYQRAGFYLGVGIANLLNSLNPQKIILGGGVWKSAPPEFWTAMMNSCRREAWPEAMRAAKIVRSGLGGHSGDVGALALGFAQIKSSFRMNS